jgi:hypothetical protein
MRTLNGYDEPEILLSKLSRFCLIGADAGQKNGGTSLFKEDVGCSKTFFGGFDLCRPDSPLISSEECN